MVGQRHLPAAVRPVKCHSTCVAGWADSIARLDGCGEEKIFRTYGGLNPGPYSP